MRLRLNLTPRITLAFVLFAAVLLAGVGLLFYRSGRTALRAAATSELLSTAIQKETSLSTWVDERLEDLSTEAGSPALAENVTRLALAPSAPAGRAAHDRMVEEFRSSIGPKYLEVFVLDPRSGKILASTNAQREGQSKKDDPYFVNGKNGPFVKNPYYSTTLKAPAMAISAPIRSARGVLVGVLVARLDLGTLDAIVQHRTGLRHTDDAYLVNLAGKFVSQPRFLPQSVLLQDAVRSPGVQRVLKRNSGVMTAPDYRGVQAIVVYRWLPTRQLGLITKMDQAEALASAYDFERTILLITALALLLASMLAFGLARSVTQPVRALQEGVARFGRGELDARLPENSSDEVGLLAREFNQMAIAISAKEAQLRDQAAQLEQRVRERTAQLEVATREVEQSARANQNMMEYSQDVICSIDEAGRFMSLSPACQRIWGYTSEELQGRLYMDLVHPDDAEKTIQAAGSIMSGHATAGFDNRYLRKDGSAAHMLWSARWSDAEKSMFCVARDISERERIEELLRESNERFRLMVEGVQDYAILMLDPEGRVASWNGGAQRIKGYTADEIIGQHFSRFYPAEDIADGKTEMEIRVATAEGHFEDEGWRLRKDGSRFWANVLITAVRDEAGVLRGFSKVTRDITARKQVEEELRAAKEAAEEASLAKSQFLANMSHEIRTPMNGVLGPIGLLLDSNLSQQQRELTEIARSSAESLLGIINDILDLSKIEVGKLDIEPIPFNLLLAVEEAASMMAARAEEKGIDLIVRYPPSVPRHVIGDPGRIRQVLANLISNAIKFTAHGHVLIDIEAQAQSEEDVALRISVQDSGIGIADDKIEHVFGRFNQADTSTTRRYGGTGLGLSISRQLVELMGGSIGATSTLGEGSTFSFTLRLPLQGDAPTISLPDADLSGVRILIVDDNTVNRRVLHEQLNNWRLRNESSEGSYKALEALRAAHAAGDPFQIAILDHQMPDMDGESLGHAIKADPLLCDTVLVMLTSLGHKGDAIRLKAAGFAAYLLKPARQSELLGSLVNVWAARNAEQSSELVTRHSLAEERPRREDALGHWEGTRVLVVEDNIVNQKVASMILQSFGCRVEVAANGREALRSIETLPFDIIFMDCEMPEMDGFEATAEIRLRTDARRTLPIIAVTARATKGDRERCLQAGMDDYMSKPVKAENFQAALERWAPLAKDEGEEKPEQTEAPEALQVLAARPDADAASPALDAEVVARLRDLAAATDASLLNQIFESFLGDGESRIRTLHGALEKGDWETLRKAAHALKGASANIGAQGMAEIAQELQALGDEGTTEGAASWVGQLEAEFERVRIEIAAELEAE